MERTGNTSYVCFYFNPYCLGTCSQSVLPRTRFNRMIEISILIVLELALKGYLGKFHSAPRTRFQSLLSWNLLSKHRTPHQGSQGARISILIVLELALKESPGDVSNRGTHIPFQSLLSWNLLSKEVNEVEIHVRTLISILIVLELALKDLHSTQSPPAHQDFNPYCPGTCSQSQTRLDTSICFFLFQSLLSWNLLSKTIWIITYMNTIIY